MEQVRIDFLVTGNMSSLSGQIQALNAELMKSAASAQMLNKSLGSLDVQTMNRQFAQLLQSSGQFNTQMVTVRNSTDQYADALNRAKLTGRQYYQESMRYLRGQAGAVRDLAAQQVRLQNSVVQPLGRDAMGRVSAAVHTPTGLPVDAATNLRLANKQWEIFNHQAQMGATHMVNWGKNTQWAGRQLMVGFTVPMMMLGGLAAKTFKDLDNELVRLQKVYGSGLTFGDDFEKQAAQIRESAMTMVKELAAAYGQAGTETAALMADLAATGFEGQDLMDMTRQTTKLATLGEVDRQEAMKATISLQSAFKLSTQEVADEVLFLNAVENQTSASLGDLVEAIPRAGTVVKGLGGDVQDLALYMVAMREGGISAAEGANALKSGLSSIIAPSKDAVEFMKEFGINLPQMVQQNQGDLTGTLMAFQEELSKLDNLARQQVITKLFGKYQFARMNALFSNLGAQGSQTQKVLELMGYSMEDLGKIADQELAMKAESVSGQWERAWETFKVSISDVGETMLSWGTKMLNILNAVFGFIEDHEWLQGLIKYGGLALAVIGPIIMTMGLFGNMIGMITKGVLRLINSFKTWKSGGSIAKSFEMLTAETFAAQVGIENFNATAYDHAKAQEVLVQGAREWATAMEGVTAATMQAAQATERLAESTTTAAASLTMSQQERLMAVQPRMTSRGLYAGTEANNQGRNTARMLDYTVDELAGLNPEQLARMAAINAYIGTEAGRGQGYGIYGSSQAAVKDTFTKGVVTDPNQFRAIVSGMAENPEMRAAFAQAYEQAQTDPRAVAARIIAEEARIQTIKPTQSGDAAPAIKAINAAAAQVSADALGVGSAFDALKFSAVTSSEMLDLTAKAEQEGAVELEHLTSSKKRLGETIDMLNGIEQEYGISVEATTSAMVERANKLGNIGLSDQELAAALDSLSASARETVAVLQEAGARVDALTAELNSLISSSSTIDAAMDKAAQQFSGFDLPEDEANALRQRMQALAAEMGETDASFEIVQGANKKYYGAVTAAGRTTYVSGTAKTSTGVLSGAAAKSIEEAHRKQVLAAEQMVEAKREELRLAEQILASEHERLALAASEANEEREKAALAKAGTVAEVGSTAQDRMQLSLEEKQTAAKRAGSLTAPGTGMQGLASMFGMSRIPGGTAGKVGFGALGLAGLAGMMMPQTGNAGVDTGISILNSGMMGASMGALAGPWGAALGGLAGITAAAAPKIFEALERASEEAAAKAAANWELEFGNMEIDAAVASAFGLKTLDDGIEVKVVPGDIKTQKTNEAFVAKVEEQFKDEITYLKDATDETLKLTGARKLYNQIVAGGNSPEKAEKIVSEVLRQSDNTHLIIDALTGQAQNQKKAIEWLHKESERRKTELMLESQMAMSEVAVTSQEMNSMNQTTSRGLWEHEIDAIKRAAAATGEVYAEEYALAVQRGLKNGNLNTVIDEVDASLKEMALNTVTMIGADEFDAGGLEKIEEVLGDLEGMSYEEVMYKIATSSKDVQDQVLENITGFGNLHAEVLNVTTSSNSYLESVKTLIPELVPLIAKYEALGYGALSYSMALNDAIDAQRAFNAEQNFIGALGEILPDIGEPVDVEKLAKQQERQLEALRESEAERLEQMQEDADKRERLMQREIDQTNNQYDKEIDKIQEAEDARQEAFQNEEERAQRRMEMRNLEISYQEAIANGQLYEAARIRMNIAAMKKQQDQQDKAEKSQDRADKRIEILEKERDKKVKLLEKELRQEQRHNEKMIESAQEASEARIEAREKENREILQDTKEANKLLLDAQAKRDQQSAIMWQALLDGNKQKYLNYADKLGISHSKAIDFMMDYTKDQFGDLPDSVWKQVAKSIKSGNWDTIGVLTEAAIQGADESDLANILRDRDPNQTSYGDDHRYYASGGFVSGRGTGTSDSIPAMLSNGEYVIRQASVSKYGKAALDSINAGDAAIPGFATGGLVTQGMAGGVISGLIKSAGDALTSMFGASPFSKTGKMSGSTGATAGKPGEYGGTMFTAEQLKNAAIIASVGKNMNASKRDIITALATAMTESSLHNYRTAVDHDSLGLFQQRPSMGWGTPKQLTNPKYASRKFYQALFGIQNRDQMTIGEAAQAVQRSAYPDRYQTWVDEARAVLKATRFSDNYVKPWMGAYGYSRTFAQHGGTGVDISMPTNTPLRAVTSGNLTNQPFAFGSYGNWYTLDSGDLRFVYAHLNRDKASTGPISAGRIIGYSGNTGNSFGPHLHFEARRNGSFSDQIDPATLGIPGLRSGGRINYDNTIANLHRGETVLTRSLSDRFEDNVANMGGNEYNFDVTIENLSSEVDLERAFEKFVVRHEKNQMRRNRGGRSI